MYGGLDTQYGSNNMKIDPFMSESLETIDEYLEAKTIHLLSISQVGYLTKWSKKITC